MHYEKFSYQSCAYCAQICAHYFQDSASMRRVFVEILLSARTVTGFERYAHIRRGMRSINGASNVTDVLYFLVDHRYCAVTAVESCRCFPEGSLYTHRGRLQYLVA
jgi:hypothetical protein